MRDLKALFEATRTIAVVGASINPARASHDVSRYLMRHFNVVPVNPNYPEILGCTCYPDLASIPEPVDMVNLFQRSEQVAQFVLPAIELGVSSFWMQLGISDAVSAEKLESHGITVVQDRCTKVEHQILNR